MRISAGKDLSKKYCEKAVQNLSVCGYQKSLHLLCWFSEQQPVISRGFDSTFINNVIIVYGQRE